MGKRSTFSRRANDAYPTPIEAVRPLVPHLRSIITSPNHAPATASSCGTWNRAGCAASTPATSRRPGCACRPALDAPIVSNPPWSRDLLHRLIEHFVKSAPSAWLLFDSNWANTRQSGRLLRYCTRHIADRPGEVDRHRSTPARTTPPGIASMPATSAGHAAPVPERADEALAGNITRKKQDDRDGPKLRQCLFNEKTRKSHASDREWLVPLSDLGGEPLPPSVQELIEIGLPGTRCVAGMSISALERLRVGSLQEMLSWLGKYSDQLRWRPEDEGDDLPF